MLRQQAQMGQLELLTVIINIMFLLPQKLELMDLLFPLLVILLAPTPWSIWLLLVVGGAMILGTLTALAVAAAYVVHMMQQVAAVQLKQHLLLQLVVIT
jgi:hypothetical protein|tara:strand:+ start:106 stop:402 length:297 start_codon:yes stop_codon:yes gene_type:complete